MASNGLKVLPTEDSLTYKDNEVKPMVCRHFLMPHTNEGRICKLCYKTIALNHEDLCGIDGPGGRGHKRHSDSIKMLVIGIDDKKCTVTLER